MSPLNVARKSFTVAGGRSNILFSSRCQVGRCPHRRTSRTMAATRQNEDARKRPRRDVSGNNGSIAPGGSVVEAFVLTVIHTRQHGSFGCSVARQLIGDQYTPNVLTAFQ